MKISTTCIGYTAGETYLISCARIRNVSVPALVRELIDVIARDQLVLATLDDGGAPRARVNRPRYARRFNERRVRLDRLANSANAEANREAARLGQGSGRLEDVGLGSGRLEDVGLGRQQDCNAEPADREADSTPEHEAENAHD